MYDWHTITYLPGVLLCPYFRAIRANNAHYTFLRVIVQYQKYHKTSNISRYFASNDTHNVGMVYSLSTSGRPARLVSREPTAARAATDRTDSQLTSVSPTVPTAIRLPAVCANVLSALTPAAFHHLSVNTTNVTVQSLKIYLESIILTKAIRSPM